MRSLKVTNADFADINGLYMQHSENVFAMERANGRSYEISLDAATPFGVNVWSIKRTDQSPSVCIYAKTHKDLCSDGHWHSVVGDAPFPVIEDASTHSDDQKDEALEALLSDQAQQRKLWKAKCPILFWYVRH